MAAEWRDGIAACPNMEAKLDGMEMPRWGFGWHVRDVPVGSETLAESMSPWMTYCIEKFGQGRSMFQSHFPPDNVSYSYNVLYNAFKWMSKGYSDSERAAMFHGTAEMIDRVEV